MPSDAAVIKQFEEDTKSMDDRWGTLHQRHARQTRFVWYDDQWSPEAKAERNSTTTINGSTTPRRSTLVFNLERPFVVKVVNGVKKLKPVIKILPIDGQADKKLADVRRGIFQSIERNTGAIPCRLNALTDAVTAGYGFYRFITDYVDPLSREQELKYKMIEDVTNVLWDEDDKSPDGSDCKKVTIKESVSKKEFKRQTKKNWEDIYQSGKTHAAWGTSEKPTITEYWFVEEIPDKAVTLTPEYSGEVSPQGEPLPKNIFLSEAKKMAKERNINIEYMLEYDEDNQLIQRDTHRRQVWWYKLAGKVVLDKRAWPGYWIPVFKVEGRRKICQGDERMDGLANGANSNQRSYNYARNAQNENLGRVTKAPYLTPVGGIPKDEQGKWNTSASRPWANLNYNAYDDSGKPLPPPQKTPGAQVDMGLANEAIISDKGVQKAMGLFGAFIGDTGSEKSGKAILAGADESADVVYDFALNLATTMRFEGKVRNELLPKVHDVPQQIRMVGEDDQEKVIWVNKQAQDERGQDYYYDLKQGKFDLDVEMTANDHTKRAETRDGIERLTKGLPPEFTFAVSDFLAKESDFRQSEQIANRFRKLIGMKFPKLLEEDGEEQSPQVMQLKQALQQMQQQLQQMGQEYQAMKMDKSTEGKKVEIDGFNAKTQRMKAIMDAEHNEAKLKVDLEKADINAEKDLIKTDVDNEAKVHLAGMANAFNEKNSLDADQRTKNEHITGQTSA